MGRAPMRSSLRSRDSSLTSMGINPRDRVKDCCRKLVAFMCTQVGVGGLVVGYAIVGALGFSVIERQDLPEVCWRRVIQRFYAEELWLKTLGNRTVNVRNKTAFYLATNEILKRFQDNFTARAESNSLEYCSSEIIKVWTFPAALMYSLSIFTMIGYGHLVPRTPWGKGATVLYAVFGIPLYVLYFLNMGKVLAETFKWLYKRLHECTGQRKPGETITVPSTACLWVIFGYILAGSIMFAEWEQWDFLDSAYFCVTSLCKLGIGDLVPGWSVENVTGNSQTKLIINFVYILLGMGLIAMCYNLMREDVRVKAREIKENLSHAIDLFKDRMVMCCRSEDDEYDGFYSINRS